MGLPPATPAVPGGAAYQLDAPDTSTGQLRGRALLLARLAWVVSALAMVSALLMALPPYFEQLLTNSGPGAVDPALRALTLQTLGVSNRGFVAYQFGVDLLVPSCFIAVGCLIVWRKSDAWPPLLFGHLLIAGGVVAAGALSALGAGRTSARIAIEGLQLYGVLAFLLFAYLFPDGRLVPRWVWLPLLVWLAVNLGELLMPGTWLDFNTWPQALDLTALLLVLGSVPFAQLYRLRRSASLEQRQQIKWVLFGVSTAILTSGLFATLLRAVPALHEPSVLAVYVRLIGAHLTAAVFLLLPVTVAFALLRYRLWDIDPLINRALLYGALTVSVVAIYGLVVGYLSLVFQTRVNPVMSLVATVVIAIGLQPLRGWLQRGVNRLLYGERDEPYRVLERLGQRLEGTLAPEAALRALVETIKEALKLPYVAVALGQGEHQEIVAVAGTPGEALITLPLVYQAEVVGALVVRPRAPDEPLAAADRALLGEVARQAGAIAETVRLTAELQRANAYLIATREQLVLTREEERRRLRRDLHDGLGPALAAQSLKVGAIRRLLQRDAGAAERLLGELSGDIEQTIGDIRRLVYNLRPPALDELGLAEALRQFATTMGQGGSVRVSVDAPDALPPLPAAVEVAAYRIAQEAVTNVVRHAQAERCAIAIGLLQREGEAPALTVDVRDDGVGLPEPHRAGVGLLAMGERAAEVGGSCQIVRLTPRGTGVWAYLPLQRAAAEEHRAL
jgi:signal transduction histidine kinase